MKKEYLDLLYKDRFYIISVIDELIKLSNQPRYKCCDNMSSCDEIKAKLEVIRKELILIDFLIEQYIKIHS